MIHTFSQFYLQGMKIHVYLQSKIADPVVQLVRISACHADGRGFESRPDRNLKALLFRGAFFVFNDF